LALTLPYSLCTRQHNNRFVPFAVSVGGFSLDQSGRSRCTRCSTYGGNIPSFIHVSDGKMGDAPALDLIAPEAGAFMSWIAAMSISAGFTSFIKRARSSSRAPKTNMKLSPRLFSSSAGQNNRRRFRPKHRARRILHESKIIPQHLRRVSFRDPETGKNVW